MRAILSFVAVNALFVAINLVAAGVMWALGALLLMAAPGARDWLLPWVAIGIAGIAASLWFAQRVIGRSRARSPDHARG